MRLLTVTLLTAVLVTACSAEIPRHANVYVPPTDPPATEAPTEAPTDADATSPAPDDSAAPEATAPAFDTSAWTQLAPSGEVFAILMPAKAEESTGAVDTPGGKANYTTWTATDATKRSFSVTRVRLTGGLPPNAQIGPILDQAAAAVRSSIQGGKLASSTDVKVGGVAARRVVFTATDVRVECVLVVASRGDVLTPCAASAQNAPADGAVDAFLASFSLS